MKTIIIGLSQIGILLAQQIPKENHDAIVIDIDKEKVENCTDLYNVNGICGSGASKEILMRAGAATADIVIAVTSVDEINPKLETALEMYRQISVPGGTESGCLFQ